MRSYVDTAVEQIKQQVGTERVICALSGGGGFFGRGLHSHTSCGRRSVDLHIRRQRGAASRRARSGRKDFRFPAALNMRILDRTSQFLHGAEECDGSGRKRKIIRRLFIKILKPNLSSKVKYLVQGTLYPDVIESVSLKSRRRRLRPITTWWITDENEVETGGAASNELFKDEVRVGS